jgi:tRNA (cmo5U34)-methyltransferase
MSEQPRLLKRAAWSEQDSNEFIDFGQYFIPSRDEQVRIIGDLIPPSANPYHVVELCGGEGLLSRAFLERDPLCYVHVFDASEVMLERTARLLKQYSARMDVYKFDLAAREWRQFPWPVFAVVSSLSTQTLQVDAFVYAASRHFTSRRACC